MFNFQDNVYKIVKKFHMNELEIILNDIKHFYVYNKLQPIFNKSLKRMNNTKQNYIEYKNIIWIFWWQGKKNMPIIVKKCIESIKLHSNGYKIIFLDKNNFKKYVNIPDYIFNKFVKKNIGMAHFSDVIRFNLLKQYGGLWIDATVYFNNDINKTYFDNIYTSGIKNDRFHKYVNVAYSSFIIGGHNNEMIDFMNSFFNTYYLNHDSVFPYLMEDYALNYCYKEDIGGFKYYVDNYSRDSNPNMNKLLLHLNDRYSDKLYKKLIDNTNMFKLTYKKEFNDNGDTFYHRLIHDEYPFNNK